MGVDGKKISAKAFYAAEVLSVIQVTKEHLAKLIGVNVGGLEGIFEEIRSLGIPILSFRADDDKMYYWLEKH